jgi:hypothetical protein
LGVPVDDALPVLFSVSVNRFSAGSVVPSHLLPKRNPDFSVSDLNAAIQKTDFY